MKVGKIRQLLHSDLVRFSCPLYVISWNQETEHHKNAHGIRQQNLKNFCSYTWIFKGKSMDLEVSCKMVEANRIEQCSVLMQECISFMEENI